MLLISIDLENYKVNLTEKEINIKNVSISISISVRS